ncbi:hypothetical protein MKW98_025332 [Papaver atlanticum]|uniref:Peripheral subunit-binding (PSBD) domain-containing protein n=1 Tax=Papaver atlanticum TaxID=357466 RepID=A0AAD4S5X9_9MAGN|nr:hypothetical protein MKW98_025332 [Papaver atlanticum]
MANAACVVRHSRKLRNVQNILRDKPAILSRWFSKEAFSSNNTGDDLLKIHQHGNLHGKKDGRFLGGNPHNFSSSVKVLNIFTISRTTKSSSTIHSFSRVKGVLQTRFFNFRAPSTSRIWNAFSFSYNDRGKNCTMVEKKKEINLPLEKYCVKLKPIKQQLRWSAWRKGILLKSSMVMEQKTLKLAIAITVEDEDDIAKFKDFKSSSPESTDDAKNPEPTPPKKEVAEPVCPPKRMDSKVEKAPFSQSGDRVFSSPLARKLAEDNNIPLASIKGTGPDGSIIKADIEDYLASGKKGTSAPASKAQGAPAMTTLDYTDLPVSQIRKITASRLLLSKQSIPHYYLTVDTCVDKLMDLRGQLNSLQESSGGKRISINDLVIKACALALRKVPQCNSSWTNDYIRQYHNVNIIVAVQTENGLFVPVVRDADKKGLSKISEEVKHLATKAKENSLKPEDYEGGTFTVSNLGGPFGVKQFCAIINPPQSGILAVGSAEKRVVPGTGVDQYKFASYMAVTLSCDHRVIDGAIGAEWLKAFKGYIENPESMLL